MEIDLKSALECLRQAEALRKIAAEMQTYDQKAARNLIDLALEYEARAEQLTLNARRPVPAP